MLIKRIFWTLLITGVIVISTTASKAQSTSRKAWSRGASVNNPAPTVPDQAAERVPMSQELQPAAHVGLLDKKTAIVGSWLGTSGEGNKLVNSFSSDGLLHGSAQGEVSTVPELGVLSPTHGVWEYLGGRQFGFTSVGILYDITTGAYLGTLKARGVVTLNGTGDQLTGTDRVDIFDADGNLVFAVPPGPVQFNRIKFASFN